MTETKTEKEILDAAKDGMARKLVTYWDHLKFIMGETNPPVKLAAAPPNAADALAISEEAIKGDGANRKIRLRVVRDGKEADEYFELKDMDARLEEFKKNHAGEPEISSGIDGMMGGTISNLIPKFATIQKTANAIDRGVSEAGSGGNKIWNFISGALKWLVEAVQAIFSRKPVPGFWDTVAKNAVPNAQGHVQKKLGAAASTDKEVATFLQQHDDSGKSVMDVINGKVEEGTYKTLKVPQPASASPPPATPALDKLKPIGVGVVTQEDFKEGIKTKILAQTNAAGKPALEETVKARLTSEVEAAKAASWFARRFAPPPEKIADAAHKMAGTIAESVGETLSNPKNKEELARLKDKPKELAAFIAKNVGAEVAKEQKNYGKFVDFTSTEGKKKLEALEANIAAELATPAKHEMLVKAIGLTGLIKAPLVTASTGVPSPELLNSFNVAGVTHDPKADLPSNGGFVGAAQGSPRGAAAINPSARLGA